MSKHLRPVHIRHRAVKIFSQYKERVLKLRSLNVCPHAYHVNQRAWCIIVMPAKTMDIIGILLGI